MVPKLPTTLTLKVKTLQQALLRALLLVVYGAVLHYLATIIPQFPTTMKYLAYHVHLHLIR